MATAVIAFHESLARKAGMSAAETRCLGVLGRMQVATPGQLAQETGLTTGAITGIIDRLEKAGYARREPNPNDRRSLLIRPVNQEKFAGLLGPFYESLRTAMTVMASRYTPDQLEIIARYLADTTDVLKSETAKLKAK
ncbi:MAG: MarR family transcriptional regulator [Asticcacaulis sp.]